MILTDYGGPHLSPKTWEVKEGTISSSRPATQKDLDSIKEKKKCRKKKDDFNYLIQNIEKKAKVENTNSIFKYLLKLQ